AWERDVPRRSGATAWTEYYDARREPLGWERPEFDAGDWPAATVVPYAEATLFPRIVPPLAEGFQWPMELARAWWTGPESPGPGDEPALTEFLDDEPLDPVPMDYREKLEEGIYSFRNVHIDTLTTERGLAMTLDFGRELVGQFEFDIEAPAGGRIDIAGAELLRDGRPWCFRKGCQYANRYITRGGRQRWRSAYFHGLRYLHVVLRGFDGPVTIHRMGIWRRQADLHWDVLGFWCGDERLQDIWEIGRHTLEVGSQEVHVDCPTREQAAYWGDACWIGLWTGWLTGDFSHLKYLLLSAEPAQYPDGQLPASIFSSYDQILFDYTLIFLLGLEAYVDSTGDLGVARHLEQVTERMLDWYRERVGETGLLDFDHNALAEASRGFHRVFIDHPGMGWHNFDHPGMDRGGVCGPLNMFYLGALRSRAKLLTLTNDEERAQAVTAEADALAARIEEAFFDPDRGVYVDALNDGERSAQISQQTNAMAVLTGVCPPERRRAVLERVLRDDPELCLCTPYFWIYMFDAMALAGMHAEILDAIRDLWGEMMDAGATTWWECFGGDERDSMCHPWSSAPSYVLLRYIVGISPASPGFASVDIRPRPDLLSEAAGTVVTPRGEVYAIWEEQEQGQRMLQVHLPDGVPGRIELPPGWRFTETGEPETHMSDGGDDQWPIAPEQAGS
ncbi:MAG: family 78 glycoside hydrolase catalytic domain, partial [Armatimonadetes bacterium]|nr:family 78 glycoside hydrolase catalytic domain [Armatimonadota bacterium]